MPRRPAATEEGVVVAAVTPRTPAARAGLRPGDRILAINGAALRDVIGQMTLDQLLSEREQIARMIATAVEKDTEGWGLIQLYFGVLRKDGTLTHSHTNHNTARASNAMTESAATSQ